ncbi:MAG TPA: hypothetical protein VMN36_01445 [Verrucomicrobiales bacterium]|nr:hypothetical protein [Verrucomicrobiales bacterium]
MRKLRRFLLGPKGQTHCYHVVSRFAGRHIVFGESERESSAPCCADNCA